MYTINRVVQVRSGTLEASLKAFSSHFSQRSTQKVPIEYGSIWQESSVAPLPSSSVSFELNGQDRLPEDERSTCMVKEENVQTCFSGPYLLTEEDQMRIQVYF